MTRTRFTRAALTAAGLSVLFLVVYSGCNVLTSLRSDVGTIAFAWERHTPFVPLMIVPYMSIDLFFVLAPFLSTSDGERQRLAARIVMAILVAGLFFLVFPLRFAFERPVAPGALGALFDWFRAMDLPFNLAPSLHIALRTILAELYHRHTRGALRVAAHVWFFLIGLSTLLVWQHHLVDVVTGFILGGFCLIAFREPDADAPCSRVPNPRIALYYAAAAALSLLLGWLLRPWGVLTLWPVLSFGTMAAAYLRLGSAVLEKRDGRLTPGSRLAFAPVLFGQRVSLRYYRRQCRPWDVVAPGVWIGRVLNDSEAADAVSRGITAVLDLTGEFDEARPFIAVRYRNIPVLDLTAPTPGQLQAMAEFIEAESVRGTVYVHCKIGYSRSAAALGAWLLLSGRAQTAGEVIALLRGVRPSIVVRPEVERALAEFAAGKARGGNVMLAS